MTELAAESGWQLMFVEVGKRCWLFHGIYSFGGHFSFDPMIVVQCSSADVMSAAALHPLTIPLKSLAVTDLIIE